MSPRAPLLIAALLALGCAEYEPPTPRSDLDAASFEQAAYPVLLRDCGFVACHGAAARPFQVYGPGRTRLDPTLAPSEPATRQEIEASYARAAAMLRSDRGVESSLLLSKPLATSAGGQAHGGRDQLGRNVYASSADPGYAALKAWSLGAAPASAGSAGAGGQ